MLKPRPLPPPEKFTVRDALQILLGVIMIPLGAVILYSTTSLALQHGALSRALPGILVGGAFLLFGLYRTLFAWGRIQQYRNARDR